MAERPETGRVFPLAHGLHDRVGMRGVPPGAARALDRIEHTRGNVASGKGARKLTRQQAKSTCLEIGEIEYSNGESGYGMIPANVDHANLLTNKTNFSIEFTLRILEPPDDAVDRHTILCWGSPYTANHLNLELFLTKNGTDDAALLNIAWKDSGAYSGTTNLETKGWTAEFYRNTTYHIRVVFVFQADPTSDTFELFVDNVSRGALNNTIGTKRPFTGRQAPIYIGGVGSYPNLTTGRSTGKFKIQDLRLIAAVIDAADATAVRFTDETFRIVDSTYASSVVGYWPLDDGAGLSFRDISERATHGYLGPGAVAVVKGKRAAPGALYLDGHTSFLQADLRYRDLYDREWRPNNYATPSVRFGVSLRLAVLDVSNAGTGATRLAEFVGDTRADQPAFALELSSTGVPRIAYYDAGAMRYLTATDAVVPGRMVLYEFFTDCATNNQEFYIDGDLVASGTRAASSAPAPKIIRIGSVADYATDNQTFWSRYSANHVTAPILFEEARIWLTRLSAAEVTERYEGLLTPDQITENIGASSATYTRKSATVTLNGTGDTAFIKAFLVPRDTVEGVNDTLRKVADENKIYHISNIAGSTITLTSTYLGVSATNKNVAATRLGGYWVVPDPSDGMTLAGAGDIVDFSEVSPACDPDYEGTLVETASQIASMDLLEDKSAAGINLRFCLDPYEITASPLPRLPQWRAGIMRKQDSPCRLMVGYEGKDGTSKPVLIHESTAYHVDDRWRITESPIASDSAPGCLAFRGGDDHATVPSNAALDVGAYAWWSWQAWVYIESPESPMAIVCRASETDKDEINHLLYYSKGRFRIRFATGGNGRDYYTSEKSITTGWNYIEATVNSGTFYFFVNGRLRTTAFDVVGGGGTTVPTLSSKQYIGWVPEQLRTAYNGFRGKMADVQLLVGASQPAAAHTTSYAPPRVRATVTAQHFYLYPMTDGIDALCANSVSAGSSATVRSHPFVPLAEGLGVADEEEGCSALTINRKLYCSTGVGPPKVWDGTAARRTGLVPPAHAPYATVGTLPKWSAANPDYAGTNEGDLNRSNNCLHFEGYNYALVEWKTATGFDLSGIGTNANANDTGAWDMWFRPSRLDVPMVLFGKNFGKESGNYAVVLEPNSTRTALRPKFIFYDRSAKAFKWFTTSAYPFTSTSDWIYLWAIIRYGETAATRIDQIKYVVEAGVTGSNVTNWGGLGGTPNTLVTSGDLDETDAPDTTSADIYIGWSPIVISDQYYHGFYGDIAEFRMVADFNNDAVKPTRNYNNGPQKSPEHFMKTDPTDAAYETTVGCPWTFTGGAGEMTTSVVVLNMNEGQGTSLTDTSGRSQSTSLEDYHAHGIGPNGLVRTRVTFYDPETGIESNPSPAAEVRTSTAMGPEVPSRAWLSLTNLPICGEPGRTIYRRIYRTPEDSDTFYLAAEVQDNKSGGAVAEIRTELLVQETQLSYDRSPTPRYSVASSDQDRLYLVRSGELGAYYSVTYFPEYVPGDHFLPLTSDKESQCRAIGQLYGYTVFFFDEAVVVGSFVSEDIGMRLAVVGTDGGALSSHSLVAGSRMLWRPARNGIYAFTGTSDVFRGQPIGRPDGYWTNIDLKWRAATGTYWRPRDQAIWVLKRTDQTRSSVRLALDLSAENPGDTPSKAYVFTVSEGPEIAAIASIEQDDGTPRLLGGDHSGAVWVLDTGAHDGPVTGARAGLVTAGATTTSIPTNKSDFDTTLEGLRGMTVRVANQSAVGEDGTARILKNTGSTLTLMDALDFTPNDGATFEIGGYDRSWKTGFLPYGEQEKVKRWHTLDISVDAEASAGLRVRAWTDFDESTAYDLGVKATDTGHIIISLKTVPRSRFLQLEFSGPGPFTIHDYTVSQREGQQDVQPA